ncbi:PBSX family phage terminase large subunit [Sphingobium sp. YC-XJ3]|uniref:PBSX family phage terminase large subunit n=1 Tax=Sphingobium sp. YC-XJ3 TaxID=3024245 RepID=UPI00236212B4|nr:PBSX family phage terminase large subunit [Sphingobium sp. YC-XJ3]WDA36411.1 PBSX family phage terminase large subunit [Sphingobium sp. YC-XJ3]WDA37854.1 PBSX family phage terminase large subunit [Sphingobium sp. YC-XJ3]
MLAKGELTIDTPRWFVPLLEPARYKGVHGGRGSGKSHAMAEYVVERCIMAKTNVVCIREVQKSLAQSVKKLIENKIEEMGVGHMFEVQQAVIKAPHGGLIIFTGMQNHTADSIKSLEGFDIAWFEEAQSCSQRSLDLLRPTLRKEGSELLFTWNPSLATDPIDALLRSDSPPPNAIVVQANYRDNPWLPGVLREELEYDRSRDPDKFAHIWLGEYQRNSEARVFKNWRVEECEPPNGVTFRFGSDFGFSVDPSCALRCWIEGRNLYVDYEAYRIGCEIDQLPDLFMSIPEAERWPMVADTSRPETISYLRRHGFPRIQPAVKGARSVEEGIAFLQSFDIIVHPRCVHLIDELTLYSYEVDDLTGAVLPKLADKNNHLIDSLRYACEGIRRAAAAKPVVATTTAPVKRTAFNRR